MQSIAGPDLSCTMAPEGCNENFYLLNMIDCWGDRKLYDENKIMEPIAFRGNLAQKINDFCIVLNIITILLIRIWKINLTLTFLFSDT